MFKVNNTSINLQLKFTWCPLTRDGALGVPQDNEYCTIDAASDSPAHTVGLAKIPLWEYPRQNVGVDIPTIYRHVIMLKKIPYTVYVGEGQSLNGPSRKSLVYQYSHGGHGHTRVRIRDFFSNRCKGTFWTEVLECKEFDLTNKSRRKAVENLLSDYFYTQSLTLAVFKNETIEYLNR